MRSRRGFGGTTQDNTDMTPFGHFASATRPTGEHNCHRTTRKLCQRKGCGHTFTPGGGFRLGPQPRHSPLRSRCLSLTTGLLLHQQSAAFLSCFQVLFLFVFGIVKLSRCDLLHKDHTKSIRVFNKALLCMNKIINFYLKINICLHTSIVGIFSKHLHL